MVVRLFYPSFDICPGRIVQQLAALPVQGRVFFLELGGGVGDAAAAGCGEGYHRLSGEVVSVQECVHCPRCKVPPDRVADVDYVIAFRIFQVRPDGRPGLAVVHLLGTA